MSNTRSQLFKNDNSKSYEVLDLSRRRDSVETRKTPSPYNSSSFDDGSPSTIHDGCSPRTSSTLHDPMSNRADTPLHHYSSPSINSHRYSPSHYQIVNYSTTSSPSTIHTANNSNKFFLKNVQPSITTEQCSQSFMLQQTMQNQMNIQNRETISPNENHFYTRPITTPDRISPYMIQAAALQQQLVSQQNSHNPLNEVDESSVDTGQFKTTLPPYSSPSAYPMVIGRDGKLTRPFKAYPRDPLSITASFTASDALMDTKSAEKYKIFRKEMLKQIRAANGGQPTLSNPKMRRTSMKSSESSSLDGDFANDTNNNSSSDVNITTSISPPLGGSVKDSAYFERRKKNNAAAKKSRDRRRIKEDEIAIRANFLERENIELKFELAAARKQLALYGVKA